MTLRAMMIELAEADKEQLGCTIEFFCLNNPRVLTSPQVHGRITYGRRARQIEFRNEEELMTHLYRLTKPGKRDE
jgi:hypothetical protein